MTSRNEEIKNMRLVEKMTLQSIAEKFGVTRHQIRNIVGSDKINARPKKYKNTGAVIRLRKEKIKDMTNLTTDEVARIFGLSKTTTSLLWEGLRHPRNGITNKKGAVIEEYIHLLLIENGIQNRLTNSSPFDVILDNGKTVEIKSRWKSHKCDSDNFYFFPINGRNKKPDFYILVIVVANRKECFIVPGNFLWNKKAIGFIFPPTKHSHSFVINYHNQFDILSK